ncbi:class D sortase [Bacillus paranthracis]|uniref:class D sortase n=1 Tax=Bacillus paranthracis TaxID=2026186 RepID=UPI000D6D8BBB|nr:class D sortase [Bacillus paranthracis]PWN69760.1 class D sortase [Bacillus cereus]MCU4849978.1 class D sortase [Bacillus paranthracis]MEC4621603.1 class D sortase [Bacillus paranthracis]PWN77615.1 class D sortase [Bacillus cereus]HDR7258811.1 class D sortase [Bacillus paranthracis]
MKKLNWLGVLLITIGSFAFVYYFIDWYDARKTVEALTSNEIQQYQNIQPATKDGKDVNNESNKERSQHTLPNQESNFTNTSEPISESQKQIPSSQVHHQMGEQIAYMVIPKIKQKYQVYWGADAKTLKKGVGMFVSDITTTPSGNGHTVLSGHRDTVFTNLGDLQENDYILVEYDKRVYIYQIQKHWITDANDRTVIVAKDKPTLTLTTCYPFNYIGDAPERYIIEASLVAIN